MREPIARLVKNGEERLVHTRAELVELRFDGWREIKAAAETVREAFTGGIGKTAPVNVSLPAGTTVLPSTSLDLDTSDSSDDES